MNNEWVESEVWNGDGTFAPFAIGNADDDSLGRVADHHIHIAERERTLFQAVFAKLFAKDILRQSAEQLPLQVVGKALERRAAGKPVQAAGRGVFSRRVFVGVLSLSRTEQPLIVEGVAAKSRIIGAVNKPLRSELGQAC